MRPSTRRWCTLLAAVSAALVLAVAPAHAAPAPAVCRTDSTIDATALAHPVPAGGCDLVGRLVRIPGGPGVHVPAPGITVGVAADGVAHDYDLSVTNDGGRISASYDEHAPAATQPVQPASGDLGCSQTDRAGVGANWLRHSTVPWYYTKSTVARNTRITDRTSAQVHLQRAAHNVSAAVTNCSGRPVPGIGNVYKGNTTRYANIDSSGACTSKFPDSQSTVSWGPFKSGSGTLGIACWAATRGRIWEADIYLASNQSILANLPGRGCRNLWDEESVATHEFGHFFGMAHSGGNWLTMYRSTPQCSTFERTLGRGDMNEMATLYPR